MIYIYVLIDPFTKERRYIGKTNNLKRRFNEHCRDKVKTHRGCWIQSVKNKGGLPELEILQILSDGSDWQSAEQCWVEKGKKCGYKLTNLTDGGDGGKGHRHTKETKKKMSKSQLGNKNFLGHKHSEKTKNLIREKRKYQIFSEETRRKLSESRKGRVISEETRRKISESNKGRVVSEWHRRRLIEGSLKLTPNQVIEIRSLLNNKISQQSISDKFGVGQNTISRISRGRILEYETEKYYPQLEDPERMTDGLKADIRKEAKALGGGALSEIVDGGIV